MAEIVKDGYILEIEDIPYGQPVTGREIQERVSRQTGEAVPGVPYVQRDGRLRHLRAEEPIILRPGDRLGFTAPFETA